MTRETKTGTAVIIASTREPGQAERDARKEAGTYGRDELTSVIGEALAGVPYAFTVEVSVPGAESYQASVETKVPTKAEKVGIFESHPIPLTLEVPVVVDAKDPSHVEIDWKAFLALPDRVARLKAARGRALTIQGQRNAEAEPEKYAAQRAQNKVMVMGWAEHVRNGAMTREALERDAAVMMKLGMMDPADLAAAIARTEEP